MALKIESLDTRKHDRSSFCCGKESLDQYIRKQASQDFKRRVATAFVLVEDPLVEDSLVEDPANTSASPILAYYTLSAFTIDITVLDSAFAKNLPRYPLLPTTLLGRLAVDQQQRGKRLGELMLIDALKRSLNTSVQIASLAVIAEALDEEAAAFYMKYGFQPFQQNPRKLYLPMKAIEKLF